MADREQQITRVRRRVRWARGKRRRRRVGSGAAAETGCGARCGPGEWRGRAGLSDGGEIEDEQNRRSIYIGRDPLVPAGNTSRD